MNNDPISEQKSKEQVMQQMINNSKYYQPEYKSKEEYLNMDDLKIFDGCKLISPKVDLNSLKNAKVFVIRSKRLDDIHKSMKYGVWTSSGFNNKKFNQALKEGPVYFLYRSLDRNFFVGLAQMTFLSNPNTEFAYWGEIGKWRGICGVSWLIVRDVHFNLVTQLRQNGDYLDELKDGSELSYENTRVVVDTMNQRREPSGILQEFPRLDRSEMKIRNKINSIIQSGIIEIYKTEVDKKKKVKQAEIKLLNEDPVVVIKKKKKKKLSKREKREFNKNQRNANMQ